MEKFLKIASKLTRLLVFILIGAVLGSIVLIPIELHRIRSEISRSNSIYLCIESAKLDLWMEPCAALVSQDQPHD